MNIDPDTICFNVTPCYHQYYSYSNFLYEQRLWAFMNFYNSFVMMIFTKDAYVVFSIAAFFQLIEEGSVALSVWSNQSWINMKSVNF